MSEEEIKINTRPDSTATTSSYRSIFKATSLFGGVQVYQILIGIARSKIIAVLLGPLGMGIQGLYHSALQLVQNCTSMGLAQSAVRDVSEAYGSKDTERIGKTVSIIQRLVWITGLLGVLSVILLSPVLSKSSFGNYSYILPFIILSITLLFDQLAAGRKVVLQGTRQLRYLAISSALGVTIALLLSIPFFIVWGVKGIIPALLVQSIVQFLLFYFFSKKVKVNKIHVGFKEALSGGRQMLSMGIAMSISLVLSTFVGYATRGFISHWGGVEEVGFFTAGFAILSQYTGMIFSAMSTDYYPRLAAVNTDNEKCRTLINQQGVIALLIMAPMLVVCILIMPLLIRILYSSEFLPANDYIMWAVMGMIFKTLSWVITYIFISKGDSKTYITIEVVSNIITFTFNIIGYRLWGLKGLGIAFTLCYILYFIIVFSFAHRQYGFKFDSSFLKVILLQSMFVVSCFVSQAIIKTNTSLAVSIMILLGCFAFSYAELEKRVQLKSIISSKFKKNHK